MTQRLVLLAFSLVVFTACGTVERWQEIQSGPMKVAEVSDAIEYIARSNGFAPTPDADRGLGLYTSQWRSFVLPQGGAWRPGRFRLRVEILLDKGSASEGFSIRFLVAQQKVKDLKRSKNPEERDWSDAGQDQEREFFFGDALQRRLVEVTPVRSFNGKSAPETGK